MFLELFLAFRTAFPSYSLSSLLFGARIILGALLYNRASILLPVHFPQLQLHAGCKFVSCNILACGEFDVVRASNIRRQHQDPSTRFS